MYCDVVHSFVSQSQPVFFNETKSMTETMGLIEYLLFCTHSVFNIHCQTCMYISHQFLISWQTCVYISHQFLISCQTCMYISHQFFISGLVIIYLCEYICLLQFKFIVCPLLILKWMCPWPNFMELLKQKMFCFT